MPNPVAPPGIHGHTLTEVLAVLALVAILAGAAVPTFAGLLLDSRRDAAVLTAMHAVHAARQLAALRGADIQLCGSSDHQSCSGTGDWSSGLLITSAGGEPERSLAIQGAAGGPRLRSNRPTIGFEAGTSFASPATLSICDRRGPTAARAVIISRSGRPRVSDRDASERPLRC
ncbi:MAG: prepilin-type N-terminal cleavage/methylation domain-containing protein [Gammaproteobacteria bacterium]|nr:MAG: prepilin-type N-terminal cleavage/methylation domain-containing protein [Gammaproteobacteria bacterium]